MSLSPPKPMKLCNRQCIFISLSVGHLQVKDNMNIGFSELTAQKEISKQQLCM